MTSREISEEFKLQNPELVRRSVDYLITEAVIRMISGLFSRKMVGGINSDQIDLFNAYGLDPVVALIDPTGKTNNKVHALTSSMSLEEFKSWMRDLETPKKSLKSKLARAEELFNRVEPYMEPGMTIGEGLKAACIAEDKLQELKEA